jgi:hypothetical protein
MVGKSVLVEQDILNIFFDYRGRHIKGITIYYATKVSLQQKLWFL